MSSRWLIALLAASLLGVPAAQGQFLFLDADGDGAWTSADRMSPHQTTFDLVLVTDANREGSRVSGWPREAHTINSYEVTLRAEGGKVQWGPYVNAQPSMTIPLGQMRGDSEFYVGFAGSEIQPPGRYVLGRLTVRTLSGTPRLVVAQQSSLNPQGHTSFGSMVMGNDRDNTLKYSEPCSVTGGIGITEIRGDWSAAAGLDPAGGENGSSRGASAGAALALIPLRHPLAPDGQLRLRIPEKAPVTLRIFDPAGRLVETVFENRVLPVGENVIGLRRVGSTDRPLGAGVYFYQLRCGSTSSSGRIVIVR